MNFSSALLDNLTSSYKKLNDNINNYTGNAINKIKSEDKTNSENKSNTNYKENKDNINNTEVIMGYATGDQGWYDKIGGGPCDTFCRYVGLSPNIKWVCSNKDNINNLVDTKKNNSGIYCSPYKKEDKESKKRGEVVNGIFYPGSSYLEQEAKKLDEEEKSYNMAKNYFIKYDNYMDPRASSENNLQSKSNYNLEKCEDLCNNDLKCVSFSYDDNISKCSTYNKMLNPVKEEDSNIIGIKKSAFEKKGVYNFYQNNSCISNNLFKNNSTISNSLGLNTINGLPVIPKEATCQNTLYNDFILNKYNHIVVFPDKDSIETKCLESKQDGTIKLEQCDFNNKNQKWYYDSKMNTIRNDKNACITVISDEDNVIPKVSECTYDINQQFNIARSKKSQEDFESQKEFTINLIDEYFYFTAIVLILVILFFKL
jgi:hypothetical protein